MKIIATLLLLILFCVDASPQGLTNVGSATFNITAKRFNCRAFIQSLNGIENIHISFLYNTFGNNFSCLKKVMSDSRFKTLQVHLINEVGHRNKRLGSYEFLYNIKSPRAYERLLLNEDEELHTKFSEYVLPLKNFLSENLRDDVELLISPGLESNLRVSSAKIIIDWTRQEFPDARVVFNSYPRISQANSDLVEAHGLFPLLSSPCVYNNDGTDISYKNRKALGERHYYDEQLKNWIQNGNPMFQLFEELSNLCEYTFIWSAESNGLKDSRFIDPRKRNHRYSLKVYRRIMTDLKRLHRKGLVYSSDHSYSDDDNFILDQCNKVVQNFQDGKRTGRLMKQSEFRERGGVILLPRKNRDITAINLYKGSRIVDAYSKVGTYKDGRIMFRSRKSPTTYPLKTFLVLEKKSRKICFKLSNPRVRLD